MATTFNNYLNRYNSTKIPLIQRDYVQGANFWSSKRNAFVSTLLGALQSGNIKTINFIYGTSIENRQNTKHFIPLDGQQRLTSLNLLGWVLFQAVKLVFHNDLESSWLNRLGLSYQTRASSEEFCAKLLKSELTDFEKEPSSQIKGSIWFAESWTYDPTIRAMLEMLDYLWHELKSYQQDLPAMAKLFFTASPIDFELLELNNRDSDDLYLKINARGKPLTEFEHWKAWFIGKLGSNAQLKTEFETKIEADWCNFFWQFAKKDTEKEQYPRIDEYFMRFFAFTTDILGAFSNPNGKSYSEYLKEEDNAGARKVIEGVYFASANNTENIRLFFSLLDTVSMIGCLSDYLFSTKNPHNPILTTEKQKVNIFEEASDLELLSSLLKGENLGLPSKFLLWGIIRHVALYGKAQLQDFIRVWWGIIMNIRQRNAEGFEVNSNLRSNKLSEWQEVLDTILKNPDPFTFTDALPSGRIASWLKYNSTAFHTNHRNRYDEDIVRLQNHPWLLYDVHVLEPLISDPTVPSGDVFDRFNMCFVSLKADSRVKALLEHGFNGCKPKSDYLTYGFSGNWGYILTDDASPATVPLCALLNGDKHSAPTKWPSNFILKYYDILQKMPDNLAFYIDTHKGVIFGAKESLSKRGFIMEPYNYVTAILAGLVPHNGKATVTYGTSGHDDEITLFTVNSTHWGICFQTYKLQIEPVKDGWKLSNYNDGSDPNAKATTSAFSARFGTPNAWTDTQGVFTINADGFIEKLPGKDRVETGVEFLKAIIQLL